MCRSFATAVLKVGPSSMTLALAVMKWRIRDGLRFLTSLRKHGAKWTNCLNVRFGSKADMCSAQADVRFAPESGHVRRDSPCPLCASSGHH